MAHQKTRVRLVNPRDLAALYAQTHVRNRAIEAQTAARKSGVATDPRLVAQIHALK